MAEKKYIGVNPEDGTTLDLVKMLNPANEFRGMLMSVNPTDVSEVLDVRDLFLAHVMVDGKTIYAYTDNSRRIVDISPHVELTIVSNDGRDPSFSQWEFTPARTDAGEATKENPYPDKRFSMRMREDGHWVVTLVIQEEDRASGLRERTIDISQGKGTSSSLVLNWKNEEIDYGNLASIMAQRRCTNILGYRLGVEGGLNEGKLISAAGAGGSGDAEFSLWKRGLHSTGLCAGDGASAWVYDFTSSSQKIVEGGVAFGKNAKVTKENAVQLGTGTNDVAGTFNFREWQLLDAEGHIPHERILTDTTLSLHVVPADAFSVGIALDSKKDKEFYNVPFINSQFSGLCEFNRMLVVGGDTDGLMYKSPLVDEVRRSNVTRGKFESIVHVKDETLGRDELFTVETPNIELYPGTNYKKIPMVLYRSTNGTSWEVVREFDFGGLVSGDEAYGAPRRIVAYDYENHVYIVFSDAQRDPARHFQMKPGDILFYYSKDLVNWKIQTYEIPEGTEIPSELPQNLWYTVAGDIWTFDGKVVTSLAKGHQYHGRMYTWSSISNQYTLSKFISIGDYLQDVIEHGGNYYFNHYTQSASRKVDGKWLVCLSPQQDRANVSNGVPLKCSYSSDLVNWTSVELQATPTNGIIRDIEIFGNKVYICTRDIAGSQKLYTLDVQISGDTLTLGNKKTYNIPRSSIVKCEGIVANEYGVYVVGKGGSPANHLYKFENGNVTELSYSLSSKVEKVLCRYDCSDDVDHIKGVIPEKASAENQLVTREDTTLQDKWRCSPPSLNGEIITIEERTQNGIVVYVPVAGGQEIGLPKTLHASEGKIVWTPTTEWNGAEPLTARLAYMLGEQKTRKLQPSGDYLVEADFAEVEINELIADKITVKDGGSIELNIGSTLQIVKGAGEAGIVIVDGDTTNELSFPNKTGNIAVDTDFAGYVSKAAIADVVDAVNSVVGTVEDKFNALMTQLEALANS